MNARCYGGEISQVVTKVTTVTPQGDIRNYQNQGQLFRGYKDTVFMDNNEIIATAEISLTPGTSDKIKKQMDYCESDRMGKNQFDHPSCGCVFKNDYTVGVPSGMLLDKAGAHDLNTNNVSLNPKHANFVFNKGATSREILEMTIKMRELVYDKFGVWLSYEMEILGNLPTDLQQKVNEHRNHIMKDDALKPLREAFQKKN